MSRFLFAAIYIPSAVFYGLLQFRMCGPGIDDFARGVAEWVHIDLTSDASIARSLLQALAPFGLLGAAFFRGRTLRTRALLTIAVSAMVVAWCAPLFYGAVGLVLKPHQPVPNTRFWNGITQVVSAVDTYGAVILHSICVTLGLRANGIGGENA